MNCRACHLVNEHLGTPGGGVRTYTDYARQSPIPARTDGATRTARRSPVLVNSTLSRSVPLVLHFDGEFASIQDLVRGTLTGRNFGWLPAEAAAAVRHVARVIRGDDGTDEFAKRTARLPYRVLFKGTDPGIAPFVRLPSIYRLDVDRATDEELLNAVTKLIGAYVDSLQFGIFKPDLGALYVGSPYDAFLVKNGLPLRPSAGENDLGYARRLRGLIGRRSDFAWIGPEDGGFKFHRQSFQFGPRQLEGLTIFLAESAGPAGGRIGNCIACHAPPAFTDFAFHNNGAAQEEYDEVHGAGAFAALKIPTLSERSRSPARDLPASSALPEGRGIFRAAASAKEPGLADLGLWNIFANDAVPAPQNAIRCLLGVSSAPTDEDLARTIALFKTPSVRDLGQTGPYFHTGRKDGIDAVLRHYVHASELARANLVRNADPRLGEISIRAGDFDALQAFLRSLNEDYND
jgi:cytochrome c peroxidase